MQIDDVLEWARDGKWHILETHPQVIAEAFEQLADLRVSASRPTKRAPDAGDSAASHEVPPQSGESQIEQLPAATQRR